MRDVVVVGSLNVDLFAQVPHLVRAGETLRSTSFGVGPGGKGLNQAVACARAGGRVHMVGALGDDAFAEIPRAALAAHGVDAHHVVTLAGERTGLAMIQVDAASGQNAIVTSGGANHALTASHVREAIPVFRSSGVLLVQLELPPECVEAALDLARECHVTTVLDPAPARDLPDDLLRRVDVLTPNEVEAEALTGVRVHDVESAARAGARLRERSLGDVIVTLGAQGCVWSTATGFEHVPAPRVDVVDTTGAGDAFNGALALHLAAGDPLSSSLAPAVHTASQSTRHPGAQ